MATSWPIAESGLQWLLEQSILTPAQAARLEAQAIADASANTALLQASLEERISRELAASYASGEGRDDWRKRMETIVNTTAWEAENIQRTYTHRAYHEGLKEVLKSPIVGDAFPYFQWSTAGDSRVRPEHAALDGKVAHKDSPLASRMSEEIAAYGCRCQMIPLSADDAKSKGIDDNTGWTEPAPDFLPEDYQPTQAEIQQAKQRAEIAAEIRPASHWGSADQTYWRPGANPTVDNIITRNNPKSKELEVLMIKRGKGAEAGKWALPGGFHDTKAKKGEPWKEGLETPVEAAVRELKEETGLEAEVIKKNLEFVGKYGNEAGPTGRDPRDNKEAWSVSSAFRVHIPSDLIEAGKVKGMDDAEAAEWVPVSKVKERKIAFDHGKILDDALKGGKPPAQIEVSTLPPAVRPPAPVSIPEPPKPKKPPSIEVSTLPPKVKPDDLPELDLLDDEDVKPVKPIKSLKDLKAQFPELAITEQKVKIGGKSVVKYVAYDDDGDLIQGEGKDAKSAIQAFTKAVEAPKPKTPPPPPTTKKDAPPVKIPKAKFEPLEKARVKEYPQVEKELKAVAKNTVAAQYTTEEVDSLNRYSDAGYKNLNQSLREAKDDLDKLPSEHKSLYSNLRNAIQKAGHLPQEVVTFRGVALEASAKEKLLQDLESIKSNKKALELDGITSSSLSPQIARTFGVDVVFEVKAKRGLMLSALHGKQGVELLYEEGEAELIQDHRTKYKVVNILRNIDNEKYLGYKPKYPMDITVVQIEEL